MFEQNFDALYWCIREAVLYMFLITGIQITRNFVTPERRITKCFLYKPVTECISISRLMGLFCVSTLFIGFTSLVVCGRLNQFSSFPVHTKIGTSLIHSIRFIHSI